MSAPVTINLSAIPSLSKRMHANLASGACIMEAVSYIAGEPWSDHPQCVCPVIAAFLRSWNDNLPDSDRDRLLRPLIARLPGTRGNAALERRRSMIAADWLVRAYAPTWLRVAGLTNHADALANFPEITDFAQCPSLMRVLRAAQKDASAAWAVARAAGAAARAARGAGGAWAVAWAAAWAVGGAAGAVARAAAKDKLRPAVTELHYSALALINRMIDARDEDAS